MSSSDVLSGLDLGYAFLLSILRRVGGLDGKASACSVGDPGLIPGLGRSPGEGNDNPLQYYLEILLDGETWQATVHGVTNRHD